MLPYPQRAHLETVCATRERVNLRSAQQKPLRWEERALGLGRSGFAASGQISNLNLPTGVSGSQHPPLDEGDQGHLVRLLLLDEGPKLLFNGPLQHGHNVGHRSVGAQGGARRARARASTAAALA